MALCGDLGKLRRLEQQNMANCCLMLTLFVLACWEW